MTFGTQEGTQVTVPHHKTDTQTWATCPSAATLGVTRGRKGQGGWVFPLPLSTAGVLGVEGTDTAPESLWPRVYQVLSPHG